MPSVSLPDGSIKQFDQPVTVGDVAAEIGSGLAKAAVAGKVNGRLVDLSHTVPDNAEVAIVTSEDEEGLEVLRHSTAHLLAEAVKELFPEAQVTIGPVVENGFYYDFAYERAFTPEDLEAIEDKMAEIAERDEPVKREVWPRDEAVRFFREQGEEYKAEIIGEIPDSEDVSVYWQGEFVDLCRGPHVPSTGKLKAFKLTKVSGAYWRGDARNEMLQRVYGTAWPDKKSLKRYLTQLEEAEKRDHRRIGQQLDLFSIQEDAGGGLVFWHPKGARIRRNIEDYWRNEHERDGYEFLYTPHVADYDLWCTSGHADFYSDSMYPPMEVEGHPFEIKPMNCPFHVLVYKDQLRSYRELPIRWAELGTVYRYEMSGALHGLMRVRGFTQDDAHIFCREDQMETEIAGVLDLTMRVLRTFGFDDVDLYLSTRPEEKSVGSDDIWEKATSALRGAIERQGMEYHLDEGGGAFYGPKIDFKIRDAIGRQWQCSTVQLDFNLPERFDLEYVNEESGRSRPIMIHRAIFGSLERFFGVLVEHYAGKFPAWLAPVQAQVLPITDKQGDYAAEVANELKNAGFRAEADLRNEKVGFKIRQHTMDKVPYMLVVGDQEMESGQVSVRHRSGEDLGATDLGTFIDRLRDEVDSKQIESEG
ncbi:threonine--tRNA ligase [Thiohalorhabdus methylotrophus]|uniref:Threonine--tRNA ligase n=1 Tax=Thiohalorhabdus methylotrophus TaxID=3242694 RepID=A0ABV4TWM5_9GAMM